MDGLQKIKDNNLKKVVSQTQTEDLGTITELDARDKQIENLEGIQYLSNLRKINLGRNKIKDIGYDNLYFTDNYDLVYKCIEKNIIPFYINTNKYTPSIHYQKPTNSFPSSQLVLGYSENPELWEQYPLIFQSLPIDNCHLFHLKLKEPVELYVPYAHSPFGDHA